MKLVWINSLVVFGAAVLLGCNSSDKTSFSRGKSALEKSDIDTALLNFNRVIEQSTDAELISQSSRYLADINLLQKKDYKESLRFLDISIANSTSATSSQEALKKKAFILFHHLARYQEAINVYVRLLGFENANLVEQGEFRLNLAKSYFMLSQYEQARIEAQRVLQESKVEAHKDKAAKMIADTYISGGNESKEAVDKYKIIMAGIHDADTKKDMALNLALWLEQKNKYKEAYDVLDQLQAKNDEFLVAKMKQLDRLFLLQTRRPK